MAIVTINFTNKSDVNTSSTPAINKVSAADMNEIKSVVNTNANLQGDLANLNTTEKGSIVGALNELEEKKANLLWENANPFNDFASTTIELSSEDYNFLEIYYYNFNSSSYRQLQSEKIIKGSNGILNSTFANQGKMYLAVRAISFSDNTHLLVHSSQGRWLNGADWTVESLNNVCIPYRVYGYK